MSLLCRKPAQEALNEPFVFSSTG